MGSFFDSLSIGTGALLVAVVSAVAVWLLCLASAVSLREIWVVIVPLTVAHCVYWAPVWLGAATHSEYQVWAFMIIRWFLAGVLPSAFEIDHFYDYGL